MFCVDSLLSLYVYVYVQVEVTHFTTALRTNRIYTQAIIFQRSKIYRFEDRRPNRLLIMLVNERMQAWRHDFDPNLNPRIVVTLYTPAPEARPRWGGNPIMTTYDKFQLDLHSLALVSRNARVRGAHCWELPPSLALALELRRSRTHSSSTSTTIAIANPGSSNSKRLRKPDWRKLVLVAQQLTWRWINSPPLSK